MNDIVTRIRLFLDTMGIANSLFADECGIPRPSLSQMLNGRNRKVSNEVIDKIHAAYPKLNIMWLMFGDGEMLVPNANESDDSSDTQLAENAFPGSVPGVAARESHTQQSINFDVDTPSTYTPRKAGSGRQDKPFTDPSKLAGAAAKRPVQTGAMQVVNVIVVYSDGTTQMFKP